VTRETARVRFSKSTASVLLDATRALAAFEVCLSHWRAMLFLPFPLLSSAEKKLMAVPYVLTGAGHQAVIIFFVLSGYLISGSVYRMMSAGTWSWRKYLTHRLVRLWIVLIPALLLGLALDGMGLYLHHAPELYSGHVQNAMDTDVVGSFTAARFYACMFFL
jgi:peptidoglycan/LPS O-acetylase OafA/YrhL